MSLNACVSKSQEVKANANANTDKIVSFFIMKILMLLIDYFFYYGQCTHSPYTFPETTNTNSPRGSV